MERARFKRERKEVALRGVFWNMPQSPLPNPTHPRPAATPAQRRQRWCHSLAARPPPLAAGLPARLELVKQVQVTTLWVRVGKWGGLDGLVDGPPAAD